MDNDATLATPSSQMRQKRILPSRSRRGGPGVGNCDVDVMILNAQLNKTENEPLIPADTPFVMKTNDTLEMVAKEFTSAGGSGLNLRAHESYFDRPEVLKAYRDQTIIETPEYTNVADVPSVGGRLRVRTNEENNLDTDAVYEKRHRKYETFEKRQRLREKEKLKHEQYKLKERIEQLRGMDNSAFLAAPTSSFSPRPGVAEVFEEDKDISILGGQNGPAYLEGERRRKEMLSNAQALEERYRVLLPPDRHRKPTGQTNMNAPIETESEPSILRPDSEPDEEEMPVAAPRKHPSVTLRLPARAAVTPTLTPKAATTSSKKRRRSSVPPPFLPPPKPPLVARRARVDPVIPPLMTIFPAAPQNEPGPSSLPLPPTSQPVVDSPMPSIDMEITVAPSLRFMEYEPGAEVDKPQRKRKRQKTEERQLPSTSRDYSAPPRPEPEPYIDIIDDELPKRSASPDHEGHDSHDAALLSYPPPPPPRERYSPPCEPSAPPDDAYPPVEPTPRVDSTSPEPPDSYPPLGPPSPPPADEPSTFTNSSVPPPEPVIADRKPSVPPIESISAPVKRRGRSRAEIPKQPAPRKAHGRRQRPSILYIAAQRAHLNPRPSTRHAFGVKLPTIVTGNDPYDFELPSEVTQDPDASRFEGSEGPDDDEEGPGRDEDPDNGVPDEEEDPEPGDNPEDDEDDQGT